MKTSLKQIQVILFAIGTILGVSSYVFTQDSAGPQPPPVDIKFTIENIPKVGEEVNLKLKITVKENMDVDIGCLLPEGVEPVKEKGLIVNSFKSDKLEEKQYRQKVELFLGPLKKDAIKEFDFRIKVPDKKEYKLIAKIEAMAKWGIKEDALTIAVK